MRSDAMKKQVGGSHYNKHMGLQTWDIIDEYKLNFFEGNALKYLLREKGNRVEDLKKMIHYVEKEIENIEAGYAKGGYVEDTPEDVKVFLDEIDLNLFEKVTDDPDFEKLLKDDEHQENIDRLNEEKAKGITIELADDGTFIVDCNGYDYDTVIGMLQKEFQFN